MNIITIDREYGGQLSPPHMYASKGLGHEPRQIFLVHDPIKVYLTKFLKLPYSPFNIVCVGELVQEWPAGCPRLQGQPASLRQPRDHRRQGLRQGFLQVCGLLGCDIPTI